MKNRLLDDQNCNIANLKCPKFFLFNLLFFQEMTFNVRYTFSVGDTLHGRFTTTIEEDK